jgi:hypothetical protein
MTKQCDKDRHEHHHLRLSLMLNFQGHQLPQQQQPQSVTGLGYPTKYNRCLGLVKMEHLLQNVKNRRMIQCAPLDILQGT